MYSMSVGIVIWTCSEELLLKLQTFRPWDETRDLSATIMWCNWGKSMIRKMEWKSQEKNSMSGCGEKHKKTNNDTTIKYKHSKGEHNQVTIQWQRHD